MSMHARRIASGATGRGAVIHCCVEVGFSWIGINTSWGRFVGVDRGGTDRQCDQGGMRVKELRYKGLSSSIPGIHHLY